MKRHYGGQALIEGVLIRGRAGVFAAVRAPDGTVITREERLVSPSASFWRKVPVVRGVLALRDTLRVGMKMMMFSADVAAGGTGESLKPMSKRAVMGGAFAAATLFAAIPNLLARRLRRQPEGEPERGGPVAHLLEGGVRISILLGYLGIIGRLKEVQRVFQYHGAEHKSISALEADVELAPASVQLFDTAHPRCGTAFLLQSMLTSTLVYGLVGKRLPLGRVGTRIALVPLVAGISFEVLQFNARHLDSPVVRLLNAPGMVLQKLTTRQPTDEQVEVALSALRGAMAMDGDDD
ncbi:MAG TPA: DUF1385 domain-containing protein [Chloroflexota bacterium]|jgi:uncharacterized protein YqhQ